MTDYLIYYSESNLVCFIIFGILLLHGLLGTDRQEKQLKFNLALVAFMLYFATDTFYASVLAGFIPENRLTVFICLFGNCFNMILITYTWLNYVMAVVRAPNRERRVNRFAVMFPALVSVVVLVTMYWAAPQTVVNDALQGQIVYYVVLIIVPSIYIGAILVYVIRRRRIEEDPGERKQQLLVGLFPFMVLAGGLVQILFLPKTPIFCFCSTIMMLVFYIQAMEQRISMDPLTKINNRSQLQHYLSQMRGGHRENRLVYVIMIDVNDFKHINDTYGHAEGDQALMIIADSLKKVINAREIPSFLARYGGDEFILIEHPGKAEEIDALISEIRAEIEAECRRRGTPYLLSVGIGAELLQEEPDTMEKCIQRADEKMYLDKKYCKIRGRGIRPETAERD